jgi:hypothetical protein
MTVCIILKSCLQYVKMLTSIEQFPASCITFLTFNTCLKLKNEYGNWYGFIEFSTFF